MGTGRAAARSRPPGATLLPEELSAEVLASLLADARDALGFAPRAAVISAPALFELPQSDATARAGKLAGLEQVVLIAGADRQRSPPAGAPTTTAAATWLVFDLGGGTFDVSLLETRDGLLRVVDHDGDNFLGGRDFDWALTEWALGELGAPRPQRRRRPIGAAALAPAAAACEEAKIELSRAERTR